MNIPLAFSSCGQSVTEDGGRRADGGLVSPSDLAVDFSERSSALCPLSSGLPPVVRPPPSGPSGLGSKSGCDATKASAMAVVSLRVSVQTEYTNLPPGFTEPATWLSKASCLTASSRTSSTVLVHRACGLRCQVPTPLQGASTRTPSNF